MPDFDVYRHIAEQMPHMSKSQKKIASYILENPNTVPFFTVSKLAKMTEVSEATVVRFATFLGYSGFPELQQYMLDAVEKQLTTVERLEMSRTVYNEEEKGIYEIFQDDLANIQTTIEKLDIASFKKAAHALLHAEIIYIVASRSAVSLGFFLEYYFDMILGNCELVKAADSVYERLHGLNENDVVVGLSFSRYTKKTIDIVSFAKDRGATVLAITDSLLSPLVPFSDITLVAPSQMPTFLDSFAGPLCLINALITYIGQQKHAELNARLEELEDIWERFAVFYDKSRRKEK